MNVDPVSSNQQSFKGTMYFKSAQKIIDRGGEQVFQKVKNLCLESTMIASIYDFADVSLKTQKRQLYQQLAELVEGEKESVKDSASAIIETCNNGTFKVDIPTYKIWEMKIIADRCRMDFNGSIQYFNKKGDVTWCVGEGDWCNKDRGPTHMFPADAL